MGEATWSLLTRYEPAYEAPLSGKAGLDRLCDSDTLWFVFHQDRLLGRLISEEGAGQEADSISIGRLQLPFGAHVPGDASEVYTLHPLGTFDGHACCAVRFDADRAVLGPDEAAVLWGEGYAWHPLREVLPGMDQDVGFLAGRALQVLNWERNNRFCGRCGAAMHPRQDERGMQCPACGFLQYPRLSPAVIVAVTREDKLLLAHNKRFASGMFSLLAGFVEPGETFEDCVAREIAEEVGIKVKDIRYLSSQPWPFPDSLMVGFTATWASEELAPDGIEIDEARWVTREDMPAIPGTHTIAGKIIRQWMGHLL